MVHMVGLLLKQERMSPMASSDLEINIPGTNVDKVIAVFDNNYSTAGAKHNGLDYNSAVFPFGLQSTDSDVTFIDLGPVGAPITCSGDGTLEYIASGGAVHVLSGGILLPNATGQANSTIDSNTLAYKSQNKYLKIHLSDNFTISGGGGLVNKTIDHNLNYIPLVRCYFQPQVGDFVMQYVDLSWYKLTTTTLIFTIPGLSDDSIFYYVIYED